MSVSVAEIRFTMVSGTDVCCVAVGLGVGVGPVRPSQQHQHQHHHPVVLDSRAFHLGVECSASLEDIQTCSRCIVLSGLVIFAIVREGLTFAGIVSRASFA